MKRWWLAVAGVVTVVVVRYGRVPGALTDLKVYRAGGAAWLHGVPLYTHAFPFWLPFTYPPIAAVLFAALTALPLLASAALLTAAGLLSLGYATTLAAPARWTLVALPCALALEPVRSTLRFGQINLILMALVAADCLLPRTRYPRGLLVGLAAAVKLTPAVFVLFFLARGQRRAAAVAAGTFGGLALLGAVLAPSDSLTYWASALFDPNRIGDAASATNQSVRGLLTRLDLPATLVDPTWLAIAVAVLVMAWFAARRTTDPVIALLVVATAGLLASPVSWSHHWVWIVPALAAGVARQYRNPVALAGLAATAVVFVLGQRYLPYSGDRELHWTWWQHVLGNSYVLVGLTFVAGLASFHRSRAPVAAAAPVV